MVIMQLGVTRRATDASSVCTGNELCPKSASMISQMGSDSVAGPNYDGGADRFVGKAGCVTSGICVSWPVRMASSKTRPE
ncbi:unnamed protein product [Protopolystoma xenopodis]|uniref:Uncharacterized protein n=1 Tax=Protopolystoma xenopodis TaxID=117903 RepID=A0A448WDH1_9PLAT|nr:unnamed protein product [Protopolystoma xenopodis]